jgi:1-acyl-sn-glycerol-3-phosphate acyltransferase
MMWLSGHIPAERGNAASFFKALEGVRSRLKKGQMVHIFPEMKR